MKTINLRHVLSALLCAATASGVSTQVQASLPTGYVPFIPPIIFIPLLPKPTVASCPLATTATAGARYFVSRDVRVNSYSGWSADSATFRYEASVTGSYKFRIVIRHLDRFGDTITRSEVKTVSLSANAPADVTTYFGNVYVGDVTNLSISHEEVTGPGTLYFRSSPGACTNTALSESNGSMTGISADIGFIITGESTHHKTDVVEYNIPSLNKYFITGRASDKAALDAAPNIFTRTGKKFSVPAKAVYGNVFDIYRFYAPAPGPNSHVYVDKSDRDLINSLPNTGLNDEGPDFGTVKPDNAGVCPTWAPIKIYRSFHNTPAVGSRNHRYSDELATHNAMIAQGWVSEGVVFCAYSS